MQIYELALLTRLVPKEDLALILKRTATAIFDRGGVIRKIDNLGERKIPAKASAHGSVHKRANYFIFHFTTPPADIENLCNEYVRDVDIIRSRIFKTVKYETIDCKLDEEMRPAPYRPEVIKIVEEAKRKESQKRKFKYNTGLDYYPFQK